MDVCSQLTKGKSYDIYEVVFGHVNVSFEVLWNNTDWIASGKYAPKKTKSVPSIGLVIVIQFSGIHMA